MRHLFLILAICCTVIAAAQSSVLEQIERNNTFLSALRKQAEAEKIDNKTGIYPANPEVEFHYLWGNPEAPGNRTDISAVQHFDFPTAYYYKRKVSDARNRQVELKYLTERKNILMEAQMICIRLACCNALALEWEARLNDARQIADAYRTKFDQGDASVLDLNKAKINLLNVRKT
ncbi:MAG: TolC family protein, partial [Candidatus Symbiothrix sp.]|nr:TolC family protein [Candidatus Symbiothrix sp.]